MAEARTVTTPGLIAPDALRRHWQGHRALTRRVIEKFPEDKLFTHSVGGMRTFGELALELLGMAAPMIRGLATNEWQEYRPGAEKTKAAVLAAWDEATKQIDAYWAQVPVERFNEKLTAFGQYTDVGYSLLLYVIDNEIHHRGQGYVYLRTLGIEPPPFWER